MVFGSFTSLNTTFDGDISRIFSAKDLIDSLNNNFDYQYDASEVVFADFQHASVRTGQLPQVNQSKEDYLGFFPPDNGSLEFNIQNDGVISDWRNVQEGDSMQFGITPQWNFQQESQEGIKHEDFSSPNDLLFRFVPSAEGNTISLTDFFEKNGYAEIFGFDLDFRQSNRTETSEALEEVSNPEPVQEDLADVVLKTTNSAAQSYGVGQAVGISGSEAYVHGDLNVYAPVRGSVSSAASGVTTNSSALTEATSFGGIFGGSIENSESDNLAFRAAGDLNTVTDVISSASSFSDTKSDLSFAPVDAEAHTRVGIKLPPDGNIDQLLNPASGAFGIANIDMVSGDNLQMAADVLLGADASAISTEGKARSIIEVSKVSGLENTAAFSSNDLNVVGKAGAELNSTSYSDLGSAEAITLMNESMGIVARTDDTGELINNGAGIGGTTSTPIMSGGNLTISTGSRLEAYTQSVIIGDEKRDLFEIEIGDQAISKADLGDAFGLYSDKLMGLKMNAAGRMDLDIESEVDINTTANAIFGDAKSSSLISQNNGAYNANISSGSNGSIDSDSLTHIITSAHTILGDAEAFGTAKNTSAVGASQFDFAGLEADIDAESTSIGESRAISNNGVAESSLALSTTGINGSNHLDIETTVRGAQLINAVASSTGFSESAAVSGSASRDLVSSTTNQEALGLNNYSIQSDSILEIISSADVHSGAKSNFGTTSI